MSATYEPGTVARIVLANGVVHPIALRLPLHEGGWASATAKYIHSVHVTDVHPLVALDVDRESPAIRNGELVALLREHHYSWTADQIEAQTRPPEPTEPTGLGAQVRDRDGEMWVRNVQGAWINLHGRYGLDPARTWDGLCEKYGPIEVAS